MTPDETAPKHRPSPRKSFAIAATVMPSLGALVALGASLLVGVDTSSPLREMGWGGPLVLATGAAAWATTSAGLWLASSGRAIPAAAIVTAATLPWMAGLASSYFGMTRAAEATDTLGPASVGQTLAEAFAIAGSSHWFGAMVAACLLSAVAAGLGLAALARAAPGRSPLGAAVAGAATLPLVALAAYVAHKAGTTPLLTIALIALAASAVAGAALGGAGAGADEEGRSGALAAAAPIAGGLAVFAAAAVTWTAGAGAALTAIAWSPPEERGPLLAEATVAFADLARAIDWMPVGALVGAAVAAGWVASRRRARGPELASGAALVLIAAGLVTIDTSFRRGGPVGDEVVAAPWQTLEAFAPVAMSQEGMPAGERARGAPEREIDAFLTRSGVFASDGERLAEAGGSGLGHAVRTILENASAAREPDAGDGPAADPSAVQDDDDDEESSIEMEMGEGEIGEEEAVEAARETGIAAALADEGDDDHDDHKDEEDESSDRITEEEAVEAARETGIAAALAEGEGDTFEGLVDESDTSDLADSGGFTTGSAGGEDAGAEPYGALDADRLARFAPAIAIDEQVDPGLARAFIEEANAQGVRALTIVGEPEAGWGEDVREAGRRARPFTWLAPARASTTAVLEAAFPAGAIERDPNHYHVRVGDEPPTEARARRGAATPTLDLDSDSASQAAAGGAHPLFIAFEDDASIAALVRTIDRARQRGFVPVLVAAESPAGPTHGGIAPR